MNAAKLNPASSPCLTKPSALPVSQRCEDELLRATFRCDHAFNHSERGDGGKHERAWELEDGEKEKGSEEVKSWGTGRRQDGDEGMLIVGRMCSAQFGLFFTTGFFFYFPPLLLSRDKSLAGVSAWCILYFPEDFKGAFEHNLHSFLWGGGRPFPAHFAFPITSRQSF